MAAGAGPFLAVIVGMATGFGVGMINGFLVAYVGITPFIVTLGMLSMARGAIWIITKGWPIQEIDESFMALGQGKIIGIPVPVIIAIFVALIMHFFLKYTIFGRRLYAIGGNEEATRLSGVNVKKIKCLAYGISGLMSSITGIILVARFSSAQTNAGDGWELDAIAAAVIGGNITHGRIRFGYRCNYRCRNNGCNPKRSCSYEGFGLLADSDYGFHYCFSGNN